ncbi:MAG TPA: RHS repeat-associated core domain-containing protein, partial [Chthoniobacterales bacterium]
YDYRNRIYSPDLGRFLQTDPIGFAGGYTNLYEYVANNPINLLDPTGLQPPYPQPVGLVYYPTYEGNQNYQGALADQARQVGRLTTGAGLIGTGLLGGAFAPELILLAMRNPATLIGGTNFLEGYLLPTPPSPDPMAYLGSFLSNLIPLDQLLRDLQDLLDYQYEEDEEQ